MRRDLGNEAYLEMRFESALHYFSVGLALNANDSVLLNNRSKTLFDLGDFNRYGLDLALVLETSKPCVEVLFDAFLLFMSWQIFA